jgi:hypothetical protein
MYGSASVSGNTAEGDGGGVFNNDAFFEMNGNSLVSGNQATGAASNGGGVFVTGGGSLVINGGIVYGNEIIYSTLRNILTRSGSTSSALGINILTGGTANAGSTPILSGSDSGTNSTIRVVNGVLQK